MIIDSLKNSGQYSNLNRRIRQALEFVRDNDLSAMADGRYCIQGDEIFMTVLSAPLRTADAAPIEAHDKYMDIQIVIEGEESFGWAPRCGLASARDAFDKQKDIVFFNEQPSVFFTLHAGEFVVFFPSDGHAPLIGEGLVRKCIIKVLV